MTIQLQQIIEDEMVSGIDNILIPTYKTFNSCNYEKSCELGYHLKRVRNDYGILQDYENHQHISDKKI